MPEPLLELDRFSYRYPAAEAHALRDVTLVVEPEELVVVAGRSGCGKTTLLRAGCGLVPHFYGGDASGNLRVGGLDVREHGPAEVGRAVGFVAQEPETQVVSTTVRSELELPLELRGEPRAARARAVEEVAMALAIPHLLDRATDTLSGGELQRVALASALAPRPSLVLLDEPTSQLDPVAGDELVWLLRRLNEEWGTSIVLAEHRTERCLAAADRVIALEDGTVGFDGAPADFLEWATRSDEALATPAARLFHLAGRRPLPTSVKQARRALGSDPSRDTFAQKGSDPRRDAFVTKGSDPRGALSARDLWVELDPGDGPRDVLQGLELEVGVGERVALMGRNGAGKSTLLRAAAGLVGPSRGRIETPRGCALLTQSPGDFLLRERVGDELPGDAGAQALGRVGLGGMAERDPADLSGGERQRLALAIATAGRAGGLICLDEPTRGLDRALKSDLVAWIEGLAAGGAAVVVATHDVEFAAAFATRTVLLGDGVVVADAPTHDVLAGGWYFATEVARILPDSGAILPEEGAAALAQRSAVR